MCFLKKTKQKKTPQNQNHPTKKQNIQNSGMILLPFVDANLVFRVLEAPVIIYFHALSNGSKYGMSSSSVH